MNAIGIDLGGTWIKGVLMDANTGEILKQLYHPTRDANDPSTTHWQQAVVDTVADLRTYATDKIAAIGLSAPGLPDAHNHSISFMPGRLAGLEGLQWGKLLNDRVYVVNDAHAALMAEARFGAAKGIRHVVMLTLGTGVGGGVLIDGKLYQGNVQRAGHLGHLSVNQLGGPGIMGMPGSLEDAIGNATIEQRSLGRFTSTYQLLEAVKQQEPFALWVWLTSVRALAIGISGLINAFSPDVVLLGGGITQAEDDLLRPLASFMELYEWRPGGFTTPVKLAHFGDMAGAVGAASFALQALHG